MPEASHPDFSKPPAEHGEQRQPTIYMTPEQYQAQQQELANLRTLQQSVQQQLEAAEQARLKVLAEKGQIEEALTQQRSIWEKKHAETLTQFTQLEGAWLGEKKNAAIAEALAGRQCRGVDPTRTAAMVRRLLADEVEATRDTQGNPIVRDRTTLRPAVDYLRERLESPEFAVFFMPANGGGSGTDGTRTPANQTPPPSPARMSPDELVKAWQASPGMGGIGLKPKR